MLIRSDFFPGPWGRFRRAADEVVLDAREAFQAILAGDEVLPHADTARTIADQLEAIGNATRAATVLRMAGLAAPSALLMQLAEQDAVAAPDGPARPLQSASVESSVDAVIAAQAAIEAAGDSLPQLQTLAMRAGIEASARWKADRLKQEIQAAVSRNIANGRPAFSG